MRRSEPMGASTLLAAGLVLLQACKISRVPKRRSTFAESNPACFAITVSNYGVGITVSVNDNVMLSDHSLLISEEGYIIID
jgi:hypothetical protein